ncbi:hypothetical protein Y032_0178g691 [Ancylostoma ceylanicum]|uniref:Uncharacterized protein n=1 Tax=Ancylostoma ceylanicum TaxID=53326 RepID=A0A016ST31_9BILA|nr:hypothetical protein Y032_0178g691 [Ancylostoma ceylanicum]
MRKFQGANTITFGGTIQRGLKDAPSKKIECNAKCDLGRLFSYKLNPNELFYSKIFVNGAKCEWVKICLIGKPGVASQKFYCNDADIVYVYIRNGFVVMPGASWFILIFLYFRTFCINFDT